MAEAMRLEGLIAQAHSNLGDVLLDRGDIDAAEAMQRGALESLERRGDRAGLAGVWHSLGDVHRARGDPAQAEVWYRKAIDLVEASGRKSDVARMCADLGHAYRDRGDLDGADAMYRKALGLFRQMNAAPKVAETEDFLIELTARRQAAGEATSQ
jgi:tetratricopeptide (TPR) repeat protein